MNNYFNESHNPTAKEIAVLAGIAQSARIQKRSEELAAEGLEIDAQAAAYELDHFAYYN